MGNADDGYCARQRLDRQGASVRIGLLRFVDWTFYNATSGAYLPGRGGGAASQHGYCTNVSWPDALPGDLVFYADDSHVGIVCGYDSVGNLLVIHCSGGQNGVVVTGREGFAVAARPDLFTD